MKTKLLLAAAILTACFCNTMHAATYYISSSTGSDTAAGTELAPWQSLNKGTTTATTGDTLYLMKGDIWSEIFTPGSVTVSAYGTGTLPIISGSSTRSRAVILNGLSNVNINELNAIDCLGTTYTGNYTILSCNNLTLSTYAASTNTTWCDIFGSSCTNLRLENGTVSNSIVKDNIRIILSDNTTIDGLHTSNTIYAGCSVQSSSNVVLNNITAFNCADSAGQGTDTGRGISYSHSSLTSGSFGNATLTNIETDSCDIGIHVFGGSTLANQLTNIVVDGGTHTDNYNYGIEVVRNVENVLIQNQTILGAGKNGTVGTDYYWGRGIEIFSDAAITISVGSVTVQDCTIKYSEACRGDSGVGIGFDNNSLNCTARYNVVQENDGAGFAINPGNGKSNKIYYNKVFCNGGTQTKEAALIVAGEYRQQDNSLRITRISSNTKVSNLTMVAGTRSTQRGFYEMGSTTANRGNELWNSIIEGHTQFGLIGSSNTNLIHKHNLYWNNASNYHPSGIGTDSTEIFLDPLFVGSSTGDLHLRWNSPCIDAGSTTPFEDFIMPWQDLEHNSIYGAPDIGAYEYQPPEEMGTDTVDTTGEIRIYADSKYRYKTGTSSGTLADLDIYPTSGRATSTGHVDYLVDVVFSTTTVWQVGTSMVWYESRPEGDTGTYTTHKVGGLVTGKNYRVRYDKLLGDGLGLIGSYVAVNNEITFNYTRGYPQVMLEVIPIATTRMIMSGNGTISTSGGGQLNAQ